MQQIRPFAEIILQAITKSGFQTALTLDEIASSIEVPSDATHGDMAFPCFILAKSLRQAPPKIAVQIAEAAAAIGVRAPLGKLVATGPYLNAFLDPNSLAASIIPEVLSGQFLARRTSRGTRVMVEYSQPNTHKAFHVGHIRSASVGDALWRLFDWNGNDTIPVNYLGDEGAHVARCLWYYTKNFRGEVPTSNRGEFLGKLYTEATNQLDLSTLTKAPFPGVIAVKVVKVAPHPSRKGLTVVGISLPKEERTVVTGASGFDVGDIVAYATPGTKVIGRTVGDVEVEGIRSVGMLCAEDEIGLSEKKTVAVLPPPTALGTEVAELFRIPSALPPSSSVLGEMRRRELEVSDVLHKLESNEPRMKKLWEETKQWSMDELYEVYRWLNCRFDHYFFESECTEPSRAIVEEFKKKGIFIESDGAFGADLKAWKLGFCLLVKRDGNILYATRDLALAKMKFERYKVDRSIYVVDSAQTFHFQQVFKVLELMGYEQAKKCYHLAFAQVVRPDGKMSSRKGNVILFSELKDRLLKKIHAEYLSKYANEWPAEELDAAGHAIALATMRYGMLNQENNSEIVFDLDEWTSRSGNTGPYLLYAYARIASMLREGGGAPSLAHHLELLVHATETSVLLHLNAYHTTVQQAAEKYAPSILCAYLYELCKRFSRMYQQCSVLNAENPELRAARLSLVASVAKVIQHGLGLLGIRTIERM